MANLVGMLLREVGLYKPLLRAVRYLSDPALRRHEREVREDLEATRRAVGKWAGQGVERADPGRLCAILSFTRLPIHAKLQCLVAKALQLRGYTPVVLTFAGCRVAHDYFRLFGIDRLVMWDQYARQVTEPDKVESIVDSLLPTVPTVRGLIGCQFRGVDVGKHALSMTCRQRIEGRLDLGDGKTLALLRSQFREGIQSVLAAERFLDEHPVERMLVRDAGYVPNGGIFEAALERGVDCIVYEQGQRRGTWIFKRYTRETKGQHYFSLASSTWERVKAEPWAQADEALLEEEFACRYAPDSLDDTRRLQSGKSVKPPEEVRAQLGLDPRKKTAVIFSHMAWDAAFFFGSCLFEDFENWLFETVKFVAAECPEMNWVIKLHPFNVFKLKREGKTEESEMRLLRSLMPLPPHVRIMRATTDINTRSLFPVVDYVLTVNGTVGMEFPCYGVPAILAGTGRYDRLGFTVDPATKEEYFTVLKKLHEMRPLSEEARELARQHFLTLMKRRQTSLEDVAPMELRQISEAWSGVHDNISIRARSLKEFEEFSSIRRLGDWLAYGSEPDPLEADR